jgi:hypothetical protein
MALATRVACNKECDGDGSKSDGRWQRGWRGSNGDEGNGNGEGKQQSTCNGIDKGGWWLAREHQRGDHTTTTVGNNKGREHAADDDGSDEEGKGGKGLGDSTEGGIRRRGKGQQQEGWRLQRGWCATKRAMATVARAIATRVKGKQRQQG